MMPSPTTAITRGVNKSGRFHQSWKQIMNPVHANNGRSDARITVLLKPIKPRRALANRAQSTIAAQTTMVLFEKLYFILRSKSILNSLNTAKTALPNR